MYRQTTATVTGGIYAANNPVLSFNNNTGILTLSAVPQFSDSAVIAEPRIDLMAWVYQDDNYNSWWWIYGSQTGELTWDYNDGLIGYNGKKARFFGQIYVQYNGLSWSLTNVVPSLEVTLSDHFK
jgi:hypothetical protein